MANSANQPKPSTAERLDQVRERLQYAAQSLRAIEARQPDQATVDEIMRALDDALRDLEELTKEVRDR